MKSLVNYIKESFAAFGIDMGGESNPICPRSNSPYSGPRWGVHLNIEDFSDNIEDALNVINNSKEDDNFYLLLNRDHKKLAGKRTKADFKKSVSELCNMFISGPTEGEQNSKNYRQYGKYNKTDFDINNYNDNTVILNNKINKGITVKQLKSFLEKQTRYLVKGQPKPVWDRHIELQKVNPNGVMFKQEFNK